MRENRQLTKAKSAKNDEFYTQYADIQKEVNAYLDFNPDTFRGKTVLLPCDDPEWSKFTRFFAENFERLGLKKLISTSYAAASKKVFNAETQSRRARSSSAPQWYQPSLFEQQSPQFDPDKTAVRGKIFVLDHDTNANGRIDLDDLEWKYLDGDGDFRSEEVCKLRDEADVIVTNPPFSLFREFLAWILEECKVESVKCKVVEATGESCLSRPNEVGSRVPRDRGVDGLAAKNAKQFLIIGNMNAITYKEVFPLIKANKAWLGATGFVTDMVFGVPKGTVVAPADKAKAERLGYVGDYTRLGNSCWFTNMEHGRRHRPLQLMTMADNIRYSRHREIKEQGYLHYDNYDAIEVPFTDAIPSDYDDVMGVPISFLDKYCPEQFEIVGVAKAGAGDPALKTKIYPEQIQVARDGRETTVTKLNDGPALKVSKPPEGELHYRIGAEIFVQAYARILIRARRER